MSSPLSSQQYQIELVYAGNVDAALKLLESGGLSSRIHTSPQLSGNAANERIKLGEGAIWDSELQRLYWIDILGKKLFYYDPNITEIPFKQFNLPQLPGTVVLTEQPALVLIAMADGLYWLDASANNEETDNYLNHSGIVLELNQIENRCNDGKVDPKGRFVVGTMCLDESDAGKEKGSLYSIDQHGQVTKLLDKLSIPNGIVWNTAANKMWHIDSPTRVVKEYEYDAETGRITGNIEGTVVINIPPNHHYPDGSTIDEDDHIWIASWLGGRVGRYNPQTGELVLDIEIPHVSRITSVAFGGRELTDLYVTTAAPDDEFNYELEPLAGSLFVIKNLPFQGKQSVPFKRQTQQKTL